MRWKTVLQEMYTKLTGAGMLDRLEMLPARLGGLHMFIPPE